MKEKLLTISEEHYSRIYSTLNSWDIPKELEVFKPDNWDRLSYDYKSEFISPCMRYIESKTSMYERLKHWNTIHVNEEFRMSDEKYEKWWEDNFIKKDYKI